jgi:hypothetical protein
MSCETRVYIANTSQRRVVEVGHRLREGEFGACFGLGVDGTRRVYCARPGARVWIGDPKNGKVRSTVNLKDQFDRCGALAFGPWILPSSLGFCPLLPEIIVLHSRHLIGIHAWC